MFNRFSSAWSQVMLGVLVGLVVPSAQRAADTAPSADALLESSDRSRGGGLPGLAWTIEIVSTDADGETRQVLSAIARDDDSRVDYTAPEKSRGQFVIILGRNMWFSRPGLRKPVPLSPRQRLIGEAANGDIATTNYRSDYRATLGAQESIDGEMCQVLDLSAKAKNVTYDRIRYWVSLSRGVGVQAEFYTVSGKLLKRARFEYDHQLEFGGAAFRFVSRMTITDAINPASRTVMSYRDVRIAEPDPSRFELVQ
jgi:outer membrane lipoprotein-sorting protein